jgi:predicted O-methyltransferase YrrM
VRRGLTKTLVARIAASTPGRRALAAVADTEPAVLVEALGPKVNRTARFGAVHEWPDAVDAFEDLAFLFSSNQLHHAIISMTVHEGAYLFALANSLDAATIVEIGRSKGGSTMLLAAAMTPGSRLISYDLHVKASAGRRSDAELLAALRRYGLDKRVELVVADSRTVEGPAECDLVLVDGDHTYEGVRADWEAWRPRIRVGGHVVFHDAVPDGLATPHEGVIRLMDEIRASQPEFAEIGGSGTLAHFERLTGA